MAIEYCTSIACKFSNGKYENIYAYNELQYILIIFFDIHATIHINIYLILNAQI